MDSKEIKIFLDEIKERINQIEPLCPKGRIQNVVGLICTSQGPPGVKIGEVCYIERKKPQERLFAEVVGFKENYVQLMPYGELEGISCGAEVVSTGKPLLIGVAPELRGRVLDALGNPLDDKPPIKPTKFYPIFATPPDPVMRPRIKEVLPLGIRAIDTLLTIGKGQRIGIFSGSGIGKSTLLGMIARFTQADINVVALVGERGREVRDFIERDLQEEGLSRSVVVVATSDKPPLLRIRAAFTATAIAEYFRDLGNDVILMFDSVTRFARAQRELGLSIGEPPATRGFTPSVFAILPRLLERSGTSTYGSITGLYTVLVEADDMNEPVADSVRAILDGHIVLTRDLAERGHYPAISVLESVSRVMIDIVPEEQELVARKVREVLSTMRDAQDLINIGAYVKGSNPKIDYALSKIEEVENFLKQGIWEKEDYELARKRLFQIFKDVV